MKPYLPIPLPDRANYSDAEMVARAEDFYDELKRRHTTLSPKFRNQCSRCGSKPSRENGRAMRARVQSWLAVLIS